MAKHNGDCNFQPSKRGNFEVCSRSECSERFPCAGNDCGHLDCIQARGELPKCHYCLKQVSGPKGEAWTSWAVHGHTRAVHYTCRAQNSSPAEQARWGELDSKTNTIQNPPIAQMGKEA